LATGILQLKPREESFHRILFEKLMKIDITVLGEGQSDVEVSKAVFNKLIGASNRFVIGFTDCEGFRNVEYMAKVIARLVGLQLKASLFKAGMERKVYKFSLFNRSW
jgi:hypothetical protein